MEAMLTASDITRSPKRLNLFERYLSIWVVLCMVAGVLLGQTVPTLVAALRALSPHVAGSAPWTLLRRDDAPAQAGADDHGGAPADLDPHLRVSGAEYFGESWHVLLIAIPILLQVYLNAALA